jgi:Sideroflexins
MRFVNSVAQKVHSLLVSVEKWRSGNELRGEVLMFLRTLLVNKEGLGHAKDLISGYKQGKFRDMNAELWSAKKIVDSTLHPGMLLAL